MTVKECLIFSAKLKLPPDVNKEERVQELIDSLRLNKCVNTKIGGPLLKGISGGEKKRTSIGVELITDPNLIFLDEPTTGLDSFTATIVIEILQSLAISGRTVITTIHQPNSEIYKMFDQLMLICKGKVIYMNSACMAVDYFSEIGYVCPPTTNPAEYFMDMMSIQDFEDSEEEGNQKQEENDNISDAYNMKIEFLAEQYNESNLK
jgi:ATP-binding cassette, subfamily G (WHITE), eye pigment precursor transporter